MVGRLEIAISRIKYISVHVPASGLPRKVKTNLSWNRLQVGVGTVAASRKEIPESNPRAPMLA